MAGFSLPDLPALARMRKGQVDASHADNGGKGKTMTDRTELLESTIEHFPRAVVLLDREGTIALWNRSAEIVTGYLAADLLGRPIPGALEPLLLSWQQSETVNPDTAVRTSRGTLIHLQHKSGLPADVVTLSIVLRDSLGRQIGTALLFHSTESLDALPHGDCSNDEEIRASQAEVEEQLEAIHEDFKQGGPRFGVLWIFVDQAPLLRKSHGPAACASMMERLERAISNGLRPGEAMGRWGDDDFLVIANQRNLESLEQHARLLAGLARTADIRWWGDRISFTVSVGAAMAWPGGSLAELLEAAKAAMFASYHAGGNTIISAPGRQECSPS
jgi:GGDEF domain-containing protein